MAIAVVVVVVPGVIPKIFICLKIMQSYRQHDDMSLCMTLRATYAFCAFLSPPTRM
jgi:hypothetical protein